MKTLISICLGMLLFIILIISMQPSSEATRILHGQEEWPEKQENLIVLQSLQQGGGGNPSPNRCSNIPSPGNGGPCAYPTTISQRNFAGRRRRGGSGKSGRAVLAPPPPRDYFEKIDKYNFLRILRNWIKFH